MTHNNNFEKITGKPNRTKKDGTKVFDPTIPAENVSCVLDSAKRKIVNRTQGYKLLATAILAYAIEDDDKQFLAEFNGDKDADNWGRCIAEVAGL